MSDVLIRDIPDDVLAAIDASAAKLGVSRTEYIRRRLAQDAMTGTIAVTRSDLRQFAVTFGDLKDDTVTGDAWR